MMTNKEKIELLREIINLTCLINKKVAQLADEIWDEEIREKRD